MGFIGSSSSSGGGSSTTLYYSKTYAEMQTLIGSSSIDPGATYFISDKGVEVMGVSTTAVSLEGRYLRSGEWNFVEYDFDNDHIQKEVDKRGNSVGCTALYLTYALLGTDPRSVFRWNDNLCLNNTVWNAVFDCAASTGQVFGNTITEGNAATPITLTGDGNFQNNTISGTSGVDASNFTGTFALNTVESGTTVDINTSSATIISCAFAQGSTIDFTAHTGTINSVSIQASEVTASNTANINNADIDASQVTIAGTSSLLNSNVRSASVIDLSGATDMSNSLIINTTVTATGGASADCTFQDATITLAGTANIQKSTCNGGGEIDASGTSSAEGCVIESGTLTISAGNADGIHIIGSGSSATITGGTHGGAAVYSNSTLIASGTSNCSNARLYSGSTLTASGAAVATGCYLHQGNTLTVSDNVDAIGVSMYTGAQCTATDDVMIEGLIMRNVSVCVFADDVVCSPGEIENQSSVNLSGTGNYGNCFWKGVNLTGSGSVTAVNSNLYQCEEIIYDDCGDVRNATIHLERGAGIATIRFESPQTNQYINKDSSNKTETFTVASNAIDFDAADVNHYTGIVVINSTDTIDTISNISATTGAAPKRFRIKPTSGNTVTFASATATNIILPNGVATVTANGTNGDWIEFEHDGTNCYITEINNF